MLRVESGVYLVNADDVKEAMVAAADDATAAVVIDAETTPCIDATAARMLVEAREALRQRVTILRLAPCVGQVRYVKREPSLRIAVGLRATIRALQRQAAVRLARAPRPPRRRRRVAATTFGRLPGSRIELPGTARPEVQMGRETHMHPRATPPPAADAR